MFPIVTFYWQSTMSIICRGLRQARLRHRPLQNYIRRGWDMLILFAYLFHSTCQPLNPSMTLLFFWSSHSIGSRNSTKCGQHDNDIGGKLTSCTHYLFPVCSSLCWLLPESTWDGDKTGPVVKRQCNMWCILLIFQFIFLYFALYFLVNFQAFFSSS